MPREHGSYACYVAKCTGCSREDQKAGKSAYDKRVRRLKAYGRWHPKVDAEPVRAHVNRLRAANIGGERIAELAGVSYKTVSALVWGVEGRPPTEHLRPDIAEKLMSVQASLDAQAPRSWVDPTGSRRRLQALQAIGWTQADISRQLVMARSQVGRIITGRCKFVFADTARSIRDLYDRLWNQVPPERTGNEKRNAAIARNMAEQNGWPPPMAWDDDSIDDPAAVPEGVGPASRGSLPEGDELLWLLELGETYEALAMRFSTDVLSVRQARYRAQKKVTA